MVSKRGRGARVRITPPRPDLRFRKVIKDFQRELNTSYKNIEKKSLDIIKNETPKRSGNTSRAWTSKRSGSKLQVVITLSNPLPQARFLNTGTKASPGRYVPQLGRRLVTQRRGFHPGIKGTNYVSRAENRIKDRITDELNNIKTKVEKSFGRNFRFRG